jgi:HK97 gp10 family phage protein
MSFDVSELRALGASVNHASGRVGSAAAAVVRKSARAIERGAERRAPVKTGELVGGIVSTTITGDGRSSAMSAEITSTSDHGGFVERGTSVMAPQPYLGPAFDEEVPNFVRGIAAAGGKIL